MSNIRTEHLDDGAVFVVTTDPEAEWASSKFPHPLITADYDADGRPFQLVAAGSMAKALSEAVRKTLSEGLHDPESDHEVAEELERDLLIAA